MEDIENSLERIGYRRVGHEPECWHVSQIGASTATPRVRAVSRRSDPSRSPVLRFWLHRLSDARPLNHYRICRLSRN